MDARYEGVNLDESQYTANVETYEQKYSSGYGHEYPDGHVVRIHRHILQHQLGLQRGKMLDYGCGTGVYLEYFLKHGFEPYGCDISKVAIGKLKERIPAYASHFHAVSNVPRLRDYFSTDFDLIFSNQTLYYLADDDLANIVKQMYELLTAGGVFYASMMSTESYYAKHVESVSDGLSKVVLHGRIQETTYINFKDRAEVEQLFTTAGFRKVQLGYYAALIRDDEGPRHHYFFVGQK
jgi:SAM-dependent methyltransferase